MSGKLGRPSDFAPELAAAICELLAEGLSLRSACTKLGVPTKESSVRRWARDDANFAAQYARARLCGYEVHSDEILDISDGISGEEDNNAAVQRDRLRVDARKWILAKMLPKVYGDKITSEISGPGGGPIKIDEEHSKLEICRRIAYLLELGAQELENNNEQ